MYCQQCGNQISSADQFCNKCGSQNSQYVEETASSTHKKARNKKRLILLASVVAMILTVVVVLTLVHRVNLKYDWNTTFYYVRENEEIVSEKRPGDRYNYTFMFYDDFVLSCSGKAEDVDGIKGIHSTYRVEYHFNKDTMGLYLIQYAHDMPAKVDDRLDVMVKAYGRNYYLEDPEDPYSAIYWWKNGTVVCVTTEYVEYISEDHFINEMQSYYYYDDVMDYFGKD